MTPPDSVPMLTLPAAHPEHCRGCRGSGARPGPPIIAKAYGRQIIVPTVKRCEHDHWNEDPGNRDPHLAESHPRATAARDAGLLQGRHDLFLMSGGAQGAQHPDHQSTPTEEF